MAQESQVNLAIKATVDEASIRKAQTRIEGIADSANALKQAFLRGETTLEDYTKQLNDLNREARALESALGDVENQQKAVNASVNAMPSAQDRFDTVSQQVGLGGDAGSALSTIAGATGISAIGDFGGIIELTEALPRLKIAFEGLPNVVSAGAQALGTTSAGLIGSLGIMAVAIGAVTLAIGKFNDEAQKQANELGGVLDAQREIVEFQARGGTQADAESRRQELQQQIVIEQQLLDARKQAYKSFEEQSGLLTGLFQQISPQEQALADSIAEAETNLQNAQSALQQWQGVVGTSATTTEQASTATTQYTNTLAQVSTASTQANQAEQQRVQQIQRNAEIQRQQEQQAQRAQAEREKAQQEQQRRAEEYNKTVRDNAQKTSEIGRNLRDAFQDIGTELNDALVDAGRQFQRDARKSASAGDILGLFELQEQFQETREDAVTNAERSRRDAIINAQRALREESIQYNARLRELQGFGNQAVRLEQQIARARLSAMNSFGTGGTGTGTSTFRLSASQAQRMTTSIRSSAFNAGVEATMQVLQGI